MSFINESRINPRDEFALRFIGLTYGPDPRDEFALRFIGLTYGPDPRI